MENWFEDFPPPTSVKKDDKPCRHIFRYRENIYCDDTKFVMKQEWRRMKRLSCKEGHTNGPCWSPMEDAYMGGPECVELYCKNPVDGKLYRAVCHADAPDWETGYSDGWSWEMVPYEEEKKDG